MPSRLRATLAITLVIAPVALLGIACSRPAEQPFLTQFFRAVRARDNATLAMMSAVDFDVREQGDVTDFEITNISEETRTPLEFKALIDAQNQAAEEETAFRKRRFEFESANRPALETIAKLEREENPRFTPAQQKLKEEWDKWREQAPAMSKATSSARMALTNAIGPAEASLSQPGQPAFAAEAFEGELVSKDVTVAAEVRKDGQTTSKTFVITIQRVEGTLNGEQRIGRPIITRIEEA